MKACPRIPLIMLFLLAMVTIPARLAAQNGSEHHPTIITFDVPGGRETSPSNINSKGTIIGTYLDANSVTYGFVRNCNRKDGDDGCGGDDNTFTKFEGPGALLGTFPSSINSSGVITGNYADTNGLTHAFLRYCNRGSRDRDCDGDDSTFITFDVPTAAPATNPTSINPKGVITGYYTGSDGLYLGFLRYCDREDNGRDCVAEESHFIEFDVPGSFGTEPVGITPSGTIAGNYLDSSSFNHGFVRTADGKLATFDMPGELYGNSNAVLGINPSGAITGFYSTNQAVRGFLRTPNGNITTFAVPTATLFTIPTSINAAGAITGNYDANGGSRGFLRNPNGTFETFDVPGSEATFPLSINASGAITGYYYDANGGSHGFLRTPDED